MNKVAQLVKLAKEAGRDDNAGKKSLAAGAVAAHNAKKAPGRLMGYHTVYHGTADKGKSDNIKEKGLKKSKGGSGVSRADDATRNKGSSNHVERSKGRTYFTKSKAQADHYSQGKTGNTVKARISDDHYRNRSKKDSLTSKHLDDLPGGKHLSQKVRKAQAAKSDKSISPGQIEGSSKYKGRKQYATKKNMKKYLGTGAGRKRAAAGVVNAAVAVGSAAYSAKKGVQHLKQEAKESR